MLLLLLYEEPGMNISMLLFVAHWKKNGYNTRKEQEGRLMVNGNVFYFDWEVDLIEWLQQNMGKIGETASKIFSYIGGETISLLLIIILVFCYKKEVGKRVSLTVLTASMWFPMIKNIVLRVRPYMAHPDKVKCLQVVEPDADPMDIVQQGFSF